MASINDLKNIGKTLAARLNEIGVQTKTDLKKLGSAKAYQKIQANYPKTRFTRLLLPVLHRRRA